MFNRILEVFDGRLRPVSAEPPLMLSTDSSWSGFIFERDFCRGGSADTLVYPHASLVFIESGRVRIQDRALKRHPTFMADSGSLTLWPAGHEARSIQWIPDESTNMVRIQLDLSALGRAGVEDERILRRPLSHQPGVTDHAVASLVRLMVAEVAAGCPAGRLYAESLSIALAAHIAERYAAGPADTPSTPAGLSRRQLDIIREHVDANIGENLSLRELALLAGLGPRHFACAFRRSMGTSPHQYVLRSRIEAAKCALSAGRLPVADVSAMLGFSSQSHFTQTFRRMVGATPRQFRQAG
jgi:AraC family transcriptional regulator